MAVDVLLGLQWGDEGKGKIVDVLSRDYDIIARFQGGPNAGHTLEFDNIKHVLHTIPSGIFHDDVINVVGNGVVIDPVIFQNELNNLDKYKIEYQKKLKIARKAHLILPTHRLLDAASEAAKGKTKIGSTLKGIGPTYMDKTGRNGLRIGDIEHPNFKSKYRALVEKHLDILSHHDIQFNLDELEKPWFEAISQISKLDFIDCEHYLDQAIKDQKTILAEGAQGTLLDIDFGTYPFVTSSNTITAGACTGLGIAPNKIGEVFGIFKAYCTRVGSGPFPTELDNEVGEKLRQQGHEFGATTGRERRCGWIDLPALHYAIKINGVTQLMMMKADVLSGFEDLKVCESYEFNGKNIKDFPYSIDTDNTLEPNYVSLPIWKEDLTKGETMDDMPKALHDYVQYLEKNLQTPIKIVSVGPDRKQTIFR
ncbi:MAG: adenylosuccinate synthase [Flavobacteriales bacterium]